MKRQILVVDDELNIRRILAAALEKSGYSVALAEDAETAIAHIQSQKPDLVVTDVTMPGLSGFELQRWVAEHFPELPVIVMTAFGTIPQAIQAIRDGAYEFITKPFDLDVLRRIIGSAFDTTETKHKQTKAKSAKSSTSFISESPQMVEVRQLIEQIADSKATVLITGESGTGKEVAAKLIHELSPRASGPFVAVSCAALPETLLESELFGYEKGAFTGAAGSKVGRFEAANGGTLFLDEIGEVPLAIQAKLLRVLQEREFERLGATKATKVDVRLVTATNRDLNREVEIGNFRLDLLYRLQVIELHLPPLRERKDDILPLARHFLKLHAADNERKIEGIDPQAEEALVQYAWPGNVRELGNVIERAVVLSSRETSVLGIEYLPLNLRQAA